MAKVLAIFNILLLKKRDGYHFSFVFLLFLLRECCFMTTRLVNVGVER